MSIVISLFGLELIIALRWQSEHGPEQNIVSNGSADTEIAEHNGFGFR